MDGIETHTKTRPWSNKSRTKDQKTTWSTPHGTPDWWLSQAEAQKFQRRPKLPKIAIHPEEMYFQLIFDRLGGRSLRYPVTSASHPQL